jgi:hypothetical protein
LGDPRRFLGLGKRGSPSLGFHEDTQGDSGE